MAVLVDQFLCRTDNYGYLVHDVETRKTAAIDAPDAGAIKAALHQRDWTLTDILITHHHHDHTDGIHALQTEYGATVTGPAAEADKIPGLDATISPGELVMLGTTAFSAIATPGHTLGHIAYYDADNQHLFSGDALFSLGCGRMSEGEPQSMWEGLKALRDLPDATLLYCGHEYTEQNARFALSVEPRNAALNIRANEVKHMRAEGKFTVPVSLGLEKATNPFLRADQPALARAMNLADADPAEVFAALRAAKDKFT